MSNRAARTAVALLVMVAGAVAILGLFAPLPTWFGLVGIPLVITAAWMTRRRRARVALLDSLDHAAVDLGDSEAMRDAWR